MIFYVYHHPIGQLSDRVPLTLAALIKVAEVEAEDLESVFMKTNHITTSWTGTPAPGVRVLDQKARSTSTGDVIVNVSTEEVFQVRAMGFVEIFKDEASDPPRCPKCCRICGRRWL